MSPDPGRNGFLSPAVVTETDPYFSLLFFRMEYRKGSFRVFGHHRRYHGTRAQHSTPSQILELQRYALDPFMI